MGNLITLPNINPESFIFDGNNSNSTKKNNFSLKNYLDLSLPEGVSEKTVTIRLLPMDLETGNPFVKIHVHNVKVPKELVRENQKPYKDYICLSKTRDIDHDRYGHNCPFCEARAKANEEARKTTDPVQKKEWEELAFSLRNREAIVLRCIERGKEDEGVKFLKFKTRTDKTDIYNQILRLYQLRKEEGEKAGVELNILDIYNGRDLNITITSEGTAAPKVLDSSISTPLSKDEEQMRKWIYDEKKWQEVFTCKPYEYMKLVSEMRVPWYDKDNDVWVDKEEIVGKTTEETKNAEQEANAATEEVKAMAKQAEAAAPAPQPTQKPKESFVASITVNEEDLPF